MQGKIENIKKLIAKGKIFEGINALKLLDSFNADDIFMVETRFKQSEREKRRGIISNENADVTRNQIVQSILEIITKVQEDESIQDSKKNRKNVIEKKLVLEIIKSQKKSIRIYTFVAMVPIIIAIVFTAWSFHEKNASIIQSLGALLVGSLSAFPLKEIVNRTEKVSVLNLIVLKIEGLVNKTYDQEEVENVNNIFWNMLENSLLKS